MRTHDIFVLNKSTWVFALAGSVGGNLKPQAKRSDMLAGEERCRTYFGRNVGRAWRSACLCGVAEVFVGNDDVVGVGGDIGEEGGDQDQSD